MALLVNPADGALAAAHREVQEAARTLRVELHIFNASTERDLYGVF
jgi:hypothetical protein